MHTLEDGQVSPFHARALTRGMVPASADEKEVVPFLLVACFRCAFLAVST
jgi:hypothetical protein